MAIGDQLDQEVSSDATVDLTGGETGEYRLGPRGGPRQDMSCRPAAFRVLADKLGVEAVQWSWALASRSMAQHECHLMIRPRSPHDGKCARAVPTAIDTWGT
jgi:hypothetical protein